MIVFSHKVPVGAARSTAIRTHSPRPFWTDVYKVVKPKVALRKGSK
jgi:hypothetical protein